MSVFWLSCDFFLFLLVICFHVSMWFITPLTLPSASGVGCRPWRSWYYHPNLPLLCLRPHINYKHMTTHLSSYISHTLEHTALFLFSWRGFFLTYIPRIIQNEKVVDYRCQWFLNNVHLTPSNFYMPLSPPSQRLLCSQLTSASFIAFVNALILEWRKVILFHFSVSASTWHVSVVMLPLLDAVAS